MAPGSERQVVAGVTERVHTGVVQFGKDWPGIFLRGQDALAHAELLMNALRYPENKGYRFGVIELVALLRSCAVREKA